MCWKSTISGGIVNKWKYQDVLSIKCQHNYKNKGRTSWNQRKMLRKLNILWYLVINKALVSWWNRGKTAFRLRFSLLFLKFSFSLHSYHASDGKFPVKHERTSAERHIIYRELPKLRKLNVLAYLVINRNDRGETRWDCF